MIFFSGTKENGVSQSWDCHSVLMRVELGTNLHKTNCLNETHSKCNFYLKFHWWAMATITKVEFSFIHIATKEIHNHHNPKFEVPTFKIHFTVCISETKTKGVHLWVIETPLFRSQI